MTLKPESHEKPMDTYDCIARQHQETLPVCFTATMSPVQRFPHFLTPSPSQKGDPHPAQGIKIEFNDNILFSRSSSPLPISFSTPKSSQERENRSESVSPQTTLPHSDASLRLSTFPENSESLQINSATPKTKTNFSIEEILKPSFGNAPIASPEPTEGHNIKLTFCQPLDMTASTTLDQELMESHDDKFCMSREYEGNTAAESTLLNDTECKDSCNLSVGIACGGRSYNSNSSTTNNSNNNSISNNSDNNNRSRSCCSPERDYSPCSNGHDGDSNHSNDRDSNHSNSGDSNHSNSSFINDTRKYLSNNIHHLNYLPHHHHHNTDYKDMFSYLSKYPYPVTSACFYQTPVIPLMYGFNLELLRTQIFQDMNTTTDFLSPHSNFYHPFCNHPWLLKDVNQANFNSWIKNYNLGQQISKSETNPAQLNSLQSTKHSALKPTMDSKIGINTDTSKATSNNPSVVSVPSRMKVESKLSTVDSSLGEKDIVSNANTKDNRANDSNNNIRSNNNNKNSNKRTNNSSCDVNKSSDEKADEDDNLEKKKKFAWPAWVYCTRYSDRPSSGPRYRKPRKKVVDAPENDKRPRTAFSSEQLRRLKVEFDSCPYLSESRRQLLSAELGLNESQVKIWFQNKRAKLKKGSGTKNVLAQRLMEEGLYNHSTIVVDEENDDNIHHKDT